MSVFHHPPSREALEKLSAELQWHQILGRIQVEKAQEILEAFFQEHAYLERPAFPGSLLQEEELRRLAGYVQQVRGTHGTGPTLRETVDELELCAGVERLLKYIAYLEGPLGDALAAGELDGYQLGVQHGLEAVAAEVERFLENSQALGRLAAESRMGCTTALQELLEHIRALPGGKLSSVDPSSQSS